MNQREAISKARLIWPWLGWAHGPEDVERYHYYQAPRYTIGKLEGWNMLTDVWDHDYDASLVMFVYGQGDSYEAAFEDYYISLRESKRK